MSGAAAAAAGSWVVMRLLVAQAPGVVPGLSGAALACLVFTTAIIVLLPHDRFPSGSAIVGAGLVAVGASFACRATGHVSAVAMTVSVDAALGASQLFRLANGPCGAMRGPRGRLLSSAHILAVLCIITVLRLLHPESPTVTLDVIGAGVSLVVACLAVAAGLRRYVSGRTPGWMVWSLIIWAAGQLQLLLALATRDKRLDLGLAFAFVAVIGLGGFIEMRRLTHERERRTVQPGRGRSSAVSLVPGCEFADLLAHELGAPLAAIRTWAHFMASDPALPERYDKTVRGIQREVGALDVLVEDVRGVTAVPSGLFGVHPRPTPIASLIDAAVHYAESLPGRHPIISDTLAHEHVFADPHRIAQVLRTLMRNAACYSPAGSPIVIRAAQHEATVRIEIIDHGIGIHPDEHERIFARYYRGRAVGHPVVPGMGVGLFVAQSIVQAHGSAIQLISAPGEGSSFFFELKVIV